MIEEQFTKKAIIALIIPLIIEQFLSMFVGMADTIMVSGLGEAAISAVSLVDSINMLIIQVFSALAAGGTVVVAQYIGNRERLSGCMAAKQILYMSTLVAALLSVLIFCFNGNILRAIFGSIEPAVMENAKVYFFISAISYPFLAMYNTSAALFRSMGNSKTPMYNAMITNLLNIGGNAILIYGAGLGVMGAAIATTVSRIVGAVIMMYLITRRDNKVFIIRLFRPQFNVSMIKRVFGTGVPNSIETGLFQSGRLVLSGLVSTFGTSAIAANAIANTLAGFMNLPSIAIGLGVTSVVGRAVGAGNYGGAKKYTALMLRFSYATTFALDIVVLAFMKQLIGFFGLGAEAASQAYFLSATYGILTFVIWPLAFTLPNSLRAAGDVKFTLAASILSMVFVRIGMAYIFAFAFGMGLRSVWYAMYIDWFVRALVYILRHRSGKWMEKRVI